MTSTTDQTPDTITTNHPPATLPRGLNPQPTGRAKSETAQDLGEDYFRSRIDPDRQRRRLVHQLQALGYTVTLQTAS